MQAKIFGDRWRVIRHLDEGGQSHVFIVKDETNEIPGECALKQARPSSLKDRQRWLDRFTREVEQTKRLNHPNVLRVYDNKLDGPEVYVVTEYCQGGPLTFDPSAEPLFVLRRFLQICKGVKYAHEQGVIHRDLKPQNIFLRLPSGDAVVGDFGICYVENEERFTIFEEVVGPRYFSCPEVRDGRAESLSFACDIYSLGKILNFLFTGKCFDRENFRDKRHNLTQRQDGYFLEHINNLLDRMITPTESTRLQRMSEVIAGVEQTIHLIEGRFNPLTIEQGCSYCGSGIYLPVDRNSFPWFGLNAHAESVHALQCQHCGNVQVFQFSERIKEHGWLNKRGLTSKWR